MNVEPWGTTGPGASTLVVPGIQYLLRAHGHAVVVDGAYGPATTAAVQRRPIVRRAAGRRHRGAADVASSRDQHAERLDRRRRTRGAAVRSGALPGHSAPLVVDGDFGPITEERVRFFQESWGLTQDGIAGRETWSFFSTFQPGDRPWPLVKVGATQSSNWRVLAAQHLLRFRGATIAADGAFGPLSGEAVRTFQMTLRAHIHLHHAGPARLAGADRDGAAGRQRRGGARRSDASAGITRRRRRLRAADGCRRPSVPGHVRAAGRWHRRPGHVARSDAAEVRVRPGSADGSPARSRLRWPHVPRHRRRPARVGR